MVKGTEPNRTQFMTANMSKSIKYCGNQFDLVTLRYEFVLGFIYCGRIRSTSSSSRTGNAIQKGKCYKTYSILAPQRERSLESEFGVPVFPGPSVRWAAAAQIRIKSVM